jgi:hypothetical protein
MVLDVEPVDAQGFAESFVHEDPQTFYPCASQKAGPEKLALGSTRTLSGSRMAPTASCMELGLVTSNPLYPPAQLVTPGVQSTGDPPM